MNQSNNIYEKSADMPISKSPTLHEQKFEQSLNLGFFDPSFHSPPNHFKSKLYERMKVHNINYGSPKKTFNFTKNH